MSDKLETIDVIYVGKRELKSGALAHGFITHAQLTEFIEQYHKAEDNAVGIMRYDQEWTLKLERETSLFPAKGVTLASIGGVYKAPGLIENNRVMSLVMNKLQWANTIPANLADFVTAWQTISRDIELGKRRKSAEKNAVADRHLSNAMEVLRDRYRKIPAGFRRGFQLWLLDELEKRK